VNTERLTDLLSTNLQPADCRGFKRALYLAVTAGGIAAVGVMLATVGPRPHLGSPSHLEWSVVKLCFALSIVGTATPVLLQSARPGTEARALSVLLPILIVGVAALVALPLAGLAAWKDMLLGTASESPVRCLLCIIGFGVIPLLALMYVLREGAPTQPSLCGALAGMVAGGAGAAAYSVACLTDTIPFIAVWYVAGLRLAPRSERSSVRGFCVGSAVPPADPGQPPQRFLLRDGMCRVILKD
jgi:hypothetical protein